MVLTGKGLEILKKESLRQNKQNLEIPSLYPESCNEANIDKFIANELQDDELVNFLNNFSFLQRDTGDIYKLSAMEVDSLSRKKICRLLNLTTGKILNKDPKQFVSMIIPNADNFRNPKAFSLLGIFQPISK